jgi:hypothetical protein
MPFFFRGANVVLEVSKPPISRAPFLGFCEAFCYFWRMTVLGVGWWRYSRGTSPRYKSGLEFLILFAALFRYPLFTFLVHTTLFFPFVARFTDQRIRTAANPIHEIVRSFD